MAGHLELERLDLRGRLAFCAFLARSLPALPATLEKELGKSTVALLSSVLHTLEATARDPASASDEILSGLAVIIGAAARAAQDLEHRMYRPGDNYGFSGAADTSSEIYRYLGAYVGTLASGVRLDARQCAAEFRAALKLYGIQSADGDPKGAIQVAIEEAEDEAASVLAAAYESIPEENKQESPAVSATTGETRPARVPEPACRSTVAGTPADRARIFISYSHHDRRFLEELQVMLSPLVRLAEIDPWDDRRIGVGENWRQEIAEAMDSASIAVALVSGRFLASDFVLAEELPVLLRARAERGLSFFWIYVSSCLYERTELEHIEAAHNVARPLDKMSKAERQETLLLVCKRIQDALH